MSDAAKTAVGRSGRGAARSRCAGDVRQACSLADVVGAHARCPPRQARARSRACGRGSTRSGTSGGVSPIRAIAPVAERDQVPRRELTARDVVDRDARERRVHRVDQHAGDVGDAGGARARPRAGAWRRRAARRPGRPGRRARMRAAAGPPTRRRRPSGRSASRSRPSTIPRTRSTADGLVKKGSTPRPPSSAAVRGCGRPSSAGSSARSIASRTRSRVVGRTSGMAVQDARDRGDADPGPGGDVRDAGWPGSLLSGFWKRFHHLTSVLPDVLTSR